MTSYQEAARRSIVNGILVNVAKVRDAIQFFAELEGQDSGMVAEMAETMLTDILTTGRLKPMIEYVGRFCDVLDSEDDKQRIAEEIGSWIRG